MLDNINILCDVVKSFGGKIYGRKRMHKIIFILQEKGFMPKTIYQFRWNYYGVYSDELANDVDLGEFFDMIKEVEEYVGSNKTYVIESVPSNYITKIINDQAIQRAIEILSHKETRVLEVLSSIIYFEKQGLKGKDLDKKLDFFKGHLNKYFEEAFETYEELDTIN